MQFSEDQAEAYDRVSDLLARAGIDLENALAGAAPVDSQQTIAVLGKAGSGKTMLLAKLAEDLAEAGVAELVAAQKDATV